MCVTNQIHPKLTMKAHLVHHFDLAKDTCFHTDNLQFTCDSVPS